MHTGNSLGKFSQHICRLMERRLKSGGQSGKPSRPTWLLNTVGADLAIALLAKVKITKLASKRVLWR
jgi:hypothetical protein